MKTVRVRLQSVKTGEIIDIDSLTEAAIWAGRAPSVLRRAMATRGAFKTDRGEFYYCRENGRGESKGTGYRGRCVHRCNDCARAIGLCPWSESFTPVEGWEAKEIYDNHGALYSYQITSCPMYVKDAPTIAERRMQREMLINGGT